MAKRNHSQPPEQARKRSSSTILTPGATGLQNTTSNNTGNDTMLPASLSTSSAHSIRSSSTGSKSTFSQEVSDNNSPPSPGHLQAPNLAHEETSISTPPVVSIFAGMITPGPQTPQTPYELLHDGTMISPCFATDFQYPTPKSLLNTATTEFFPIFKSGNVFITTALVNPPKQWRLHSNILARFSSWFAKSLLSTTIGSIELMWASYTIEEVDGKILLLQRHATEERPVIQNISDINIGDVTIKIENDDSDSKVSICRTPDRTDMIDIYDQILGAFYNVPFHIPTVNVAASLTHSERITKTAGETGCLENLPHLTSQINATLAQHRHSLFRAIKDDPARWLILSLSLHNDSIYTEALIHMCGAHPCWPWPTPRSVLPEEILHLITTKSQELNQRCTEVERDLLLLTIHIGRNTNNHPVSPLPNSEFDTWFIVSTFRSILAQEFTTLDNKHKKPLLRGTMYRKIRKAEGYMSYEEMRRMMEQVMPSAVSNLSEDLAMLKREASEYVKDLARNECLLDVEEQHVGWLTCVKVEKKDIPWRAEEREGNGEGS